MVEEELEVGRIAILARLIRSIPDTIMCTISSTTITNLPLQTTIIRIIKMVGEEGGVDRTIIDNMMGHPHATVIIIIINTRIIIVLLVIATVRGILLQDHMTDIASTSTNPILMRTIETTGTIIDPIMSSGDTTIVEEMMEEEGTTVVIDVSVIINSILKQQEEEGSLINPTHIEIDNRTETTVTTEVLVPQDNITTTINTGDRGKEKKDTIIQRKLHLKLTTLVGTLVYHPYMVVVVVVVVVEYSETRRGEAMQEETMRGTLPNNRIPLPEEVMTLGTIDIRLVAVEITTDTPTTNVTSATSIVEGVKGTREKMIMAIVKE